MSVDEHLIPIEVLRSTLQQLGAGAPRLGPGTLDSPGEEASVFCQILERYPSRLPAPFNTGIRVFYTRLYWFNRLVQLRRTLSGVDAGLEQQAFKILETPPDGVDWELVDEILEAAKT